MTSQTIKSTKQDISLPTYTTPLVIPLDQRPNVFGACTVGHGVSGNCTNGQYAATGCISGTGAAPSCTVGGSFA
jgi:hypothetical protein